MGFYETVYECGCIGMFTTLDMSCWMDTICENHTLKKGNKFNYSLIKFYEKFAITTSERYLFYNKYNLCEVIDFKLNHNRKMLVRLKTTFDGSLLNKNKNIIFSEFNDCNAFEKLDDGNYILTYFFFDECIERIHDENAIYNWQTGKIIKNNNSNGNDNFNDNSNGNVISNNNIDNTKIANDNVTNTEIANDNVTNTEFANDNVTNIEIANDNFTNNNISESEIANDNFTNNNISESKIANDNTTNNNISESEIANDNVTNNNIFESKIANDNTNNNNISESEITNDNVTNNNISESENDAKNII